MPTSAMCSRTCSSTSTSSRKFVAGRRARAAGVLAAALLAVPLLTGCGEEGARAFAVTVTDASTMSCTGYGPLGHDVQRLAALAVLYEDAYAKARTEAPPRPQGRRLALSPAGDTVSAWLDAPLDETFIFGPDDVFEGPAYDDYLDSVFEDRRSVPEERVLSRSILTATFADGLFEGRILRTENDYSAAWAHDPPNTYLACVRSLTIVGGELTSP